jgi:hypothetical protein
MWERDLPLERLKLHCVYKERNWNTNRSADLTLRRTPTLFGKDVHISHMCYFKRLRTLLAVVHNVLQFTHSTEIHLQLQLLKINLLQTFTSLELRHYH